MRVWLGADEKYPEFIWSEEKSDGIHLRGEYEIPDALWQEYKDARERLGFIEERLKDILRDQGW